MDSHTTIRLHKEPFSAYSHFAGFAAGLVGSVPLFILSLGDTPRAAGMALYGITLVLLFLSSASYHFFDIGENGNRWLQRLDHAAIFLFIAGTYIPPLLYVLDGTFRIVMLISVSTIAIAGVVFKLIWIDCPRWLSAGLYLLQGWLIVIPGWFVVTRFSALELSLLVAGGLIYTAGAIVYATEKPDPYPGVFGNHDLWHLFVLGGAGCHFAFMWVIVQQPYPPFTG